CSSDLIRIAQVFPSSRSGHQRIIVRRPTNPRAGLEAFTNGACVCRIVAAVGQRVDRQLTREGKAIIPREEVAGPVRNGSAGPSREKVSVSVRVPSVCSLTRQIKICRGRYRDLDFGSGSKFKGGRSVVFTLEQEGVIGHQ